MAVVSPCGKKLRFPAQGLQFGSGDRDQDVLGRIGSAKGIVLTWPPNRDEAVPYPR